MIVVVRVVLEDVFEGGSGDLHRHSLAGMVQFTTGGQTTLV
jgi:hypothetical protein